VTYLGERVFDLVEAQLIVVVTQVMFVEAVDGRRQRLRRALQRALQLPRVLLPYSSHADALVAWSSGRTSVFGRRAFAVLRLTCS